MRVPRTVHTGLRPPPVARAPRPAVAATPLRKTLVVKFGACVSALEIPATQERLANDLRISLRGRRRTEILFREDPAENVYVALAEVAQEGDHRPEAMPGNTAALLEFLDKNRYGWLVMASAWAEV